MRPVRTQPVASPTTSRAVDPLPWSFDRAPTKGGTLSTLTLSAKALMKAITGWAMRTPASSADQRSMTTDPGSRSSGKSASSSGVPTRSQAWVAARPSKTASSTSSRR